MSNLEQPMRSQRAHTPNMFEHSCPTGPPPIPDSCASEAETVVNPFLPDSIFRFLVVALTAIAVLLSTSILIAVSRSAHDLGRSAEINSVTVANKLQNDLHSTSDIKRKPVAEVNDEEMDGENSDVLPGCHNQGCDSCESEKKMNENQQDEVLLASEFPIPTKTEEVAAEADSDPALAYYVTSTAGHKEANIDQAKEKARVDSRKNTTGILHDVLLIMKLGKSKSDSATNDNDTNEIAELAATNKPTESRTPEKASEPATKEEQDKPAPISAPYYGTKIKWHRLVEDAAKQAKAENKLVFLLHVSGNFTKEEFT